MHTLLRRAAVILGSVSLMGFAATGSAQASPATGIPWPEVYGCVTDFDLGACAAARDAEGWALGTAQALFPAASLEDGQGDAFRHCAWNGAITQRVGSERAERVTTRHEVLDPRRQNDMRGYLTMGMDLANNASGRAIGARANAEGGSDTWGWIIDECYAAATNGSLVTLS
jgi:hypothetical protein